MDRVNGSDFILVAFSAAFLVAKKLNGNYTKRTLPSRS